LKIIPNSSAKHAVKEKMSPILHHMCMAKHTIIIISHLPLSSENHVLGVNSIMQNKPGKKLVLRDAFTLPYSTRRMMNSKMTEMLFVDKTRLEDPFSTVENPRIIIIRQKLKTTQ
jgi:hypothetical protein